MRWESSGQLTGTVELHDPLADPNVTSALRQTFAAVTIGDWLGGACVGSDDTWLVVKIPLNDVSKAVLDQGPEDLPNSFADIPAQASLNSARTLITFSVTGSVLKDANPICADATVYRGYSSGLDDQSSSTFGFLLDGFSYLDGAAKRRAEDDFWFPFLGTNSTFRGRPNRGITSERQHCAQEYRGRFRCSGSSLLSGVPGQPRLNVRGTMTYPDKPKSRLNPWVYNLQADTVWTRCPSRRWVQRKLRGRPCHMTAHFRGTGRLADASWRGPL